MCGFAGERPASGSVDPEALARMAAVLEPRGPDGHGTWIERGVGLTHRRLAIIDTSDAGVQPMVSDADDLAIVFNGCIYNYRELRRELLEAGAEFRSTSDTEVILHGWARWGEGLVDRLVGMFAFVIVERRTGRLTLVRDRLGIKPLYYAELPGGGIRFASTLPALLAAGGIDTSVDPVALHHYLSLHAIVPAPRTILRGASKVPPATILTIEPDGTRRERTFWDPPFERLDQHSDWSEADWIDAMRAALRLAVQRRQVADVPVGVLLSGGLDSSLLVAMLAEAGQTDLGTFSIGFDDGGGEQGNEFAYSDLVAREFGTDHHQFHIPRRELISALPQAIGAMSEPMVSHDCVAFWLLGRTVSEHCKVVQSGQGADEVLGGYFWYPPLLEDDGDGLDTYADAFFDRPDDEIDVLLDPRWRVPHDPTQQLVSDHFDRPGAEHAIDRGLRIDTQIMLVDDPVKRVDNMTMAHGLEARTPFLDHELIELAAACPPELKLAQGGKGVLKDAARGLVPDAVIDRKKGYFPVPALSHLEGPVLGMVREALLAPEAKARGLFDQAIVEEMLADPNVHRTNLNGSSLWQLGLLELWLQTHVG